MVSPLLQRFLNAGLLDVDDEEIKLRYLQKSSRALAKTLAAEPVQLPPYTLVALDPKVPGDDPVLEAVEQTVIAQWRTLRNRFPDRPLRLLRAVILAALDQCAERKDTRFAAIVWLSGSSFLTRLSPSAEADLLREFLLKVGTTAEEAAARAWSPTSSEIPRIPTPRIGGMDAPTGGGNRETLEEALPPANAANFSSSAATAIAAAIERATRSSSSAQSRVFESLLRDHAKAVRAAMRTSMKHTAETVESLQRRSMLLWWRETLYSPIACTGYRSLSPSAASLLMALDLARLARPHAPQSVDYLLQEAVREMLRHRTDTMMPRLSVPEFCGEARSGLPDVNVLPTPLDFPDGRIPLAAYVRHELLGHETATGDALQRRIGLSPEQELPLDALAVWLFRDFQAEAMAGKDR